MANSEREKMQKKMEEETRKQNELLNQLKRAQEELENKNKILDESNGKLLNYEEQKRAKIRKKVDTEISPYFDKLIEGAKDEDQKKNILALKEDIYNKINFEGSTPMEVSDRLDQLMPTVEAISTVASDAQMKSSELNKYFTKFNEQQEELNKTKETLTEKDKMLKEREDALKEMEEKYKSIEEKLKNKENTINNKDIHFENNSSEQKEVKDGEKPENTENTSSQPQQQQQQQQQQVPSQHQVDMEYIRTGAVDMPPLHTISATASRFSDYESPGFNLLYDDASKYANSWNSMNLNIQPKDYSKLVMKTHGM